MTLIDAIQWYPGRKKLPLEFSTGSRTIVIWGDPDILSDFLNDVNDVKFRAGSIKTQSVKGHTRRRWPGDQGKSVKEHDRRVMLGGGMEGSSVIPGEPFTLLKGAVILERFEVSQRSNFNYVGSLTVLREVIQIKRKVPLILIAPSGERYPYTSAAPTS